MEKIGACMKLVLAHTETVMASYPQAANRGYLERHCKAWNMPRGIERGLKFLIVGYARYADSYAASCDVKLGDCGYMGGYNHAKDMIRAMIDMLTCETGKRFDCGSLDRLIRAIAEASGVELEP